MKTLLAAVALILTLFTVILHATYPRPKVGSKVPIVWATDPNPLRDDQVRVFNQLHPAIYLAIDPNNGGKEKVIVQSLAGVGPDVFDFWGEADGGAYIASGIALDLTDALREAGIDYVRDTWPMALPWTTRDGRIYAVPANVGNDAVWFHKDRFDAAGVRYPKAPWKLEDLVETAKKLTIRDASGKVTQYGFLCDFNGSFNCWLPSFGGSLFDDKGLECLVDSPEAIKDLEFVHSLIYKYKVSPSPQDEQSLTAGGGWGGGAGAMAYFRRQFGAMALGGRWWLAQLRGDIKDRDFQLGSAEIPIAKFNRFAAGGTRSVMVNARGKHIPQALEFITYLCGPEYNQLLNDQADALSGIRMYAYTSRYLNNPRDPGADFHGAFRNSLEHGVILRGTPYLPKSEVDIYLNRQLDLVKLNQKPPAEALKTAKRDIMAAMRKNIERQPALREKFEAAGGRL